MKTILTLLLVLNILPVALPAQPVISRNEYYNYGDVVKMSGCDATGITAGAAGASVMWDFSTLHNSGETFTTTFLHDTSTIFLTSNMMIVQPNGSLQHVKQTGTETVVNGFYDNYAHSTTFYNLYTSSKRPFTYLSSYIDTFRVNNPALSMNGTGVLSVVGDGYGTLMLPGGTFSNVLRIKKYMVETDTTMAGSFSTFTTTYLWFDTAHDAPLLKIDTVNAITGITEHVQYLMIPTSVPQVNTSQCGATGYFTNSELLLTGVFEDGKIYEVTIVNLIGARVYTGEFAAAGNTARIGMNNQLQPGIYIVSINQRYLPSSREVLRVIKQ